MKTFTYFLAVIVRWQQNVFFDLIQPLNLALLLTLWTFPNPYYQLCFSFGILDGLSEPLNSKMKPVTKQRHQNIAQQYRPIRWSSHLMDRIPFLWLLHMTDRRRTHSPLPQHIKLVFILEAIKLFCAYLNTIANFIECAKLSFKLSTSWSNSCILELNLIQCQKHVKLDTNELISIWITL